VAEYRKELSSQGSKVKTDPLYMQRVIELTFGNKGRFFIHELTKGGRADEGKVKAALAADAYRHVVFLGGGSDNYGLDLATGLGC
jgi:hypothetical protein